MQEKSTTTIEYEFLETVGDALVAVDISGASVVVIRHRFPDGTIEDKTLGDGDISFLTDGTDGIVRYKFTVAEAVRGEYDVQGFVQWGVVSEFWSDLKSFFLKPNLPAAA